MHLTEWQSWTVLENYGAFVTEVCDKCGKILGWIRFTRYRQNGEWCSKACRDGFERKAGTCMGCGVPLNGKRKGALFCCDTCRKRWRVKNCKIIAETPIEKSVLMDTISASRYRDSLKGRKSLSGALIAKYKLQ